MDADDDGYTSAGGGTVESADLLCDGAGEATDLASAGDCDDASAAYNPGAIEDDCADPADYNCDGSSGLVDADADGFAACEECDDGLGTVNPDADEVCDGADNDCDGTIDIDAIDAGTW
ncbi:MAG: MopE-related protein [Pseudomonadota bacterium]|nr:MopE-related protein [Pseudomonadota bacterium]